MRNISFSPKAYSDLVEWSRTDKKLFAKISSQIEETAKTPFQGKGKPEPLKHDLKGYWSRQISEEHRACLQSQGR